MSSTVLLSASVMLVVLLVSGVAFAAILNCVAGEDSCARIKKDDTYNGSEKIDNPYMFRHAISLGRTCKQLARSKFYSPGAVCSE